VNTRDNVRDHLIIFNTYCYEHLYMATFIHLLKLIAITQTAV